ncbi:MAG: 3-oxoacyl-ACP synthase, partial [Williamsia sp.]|nr:3-oxoacyl-ACP synthase [Williamsia sp.]
MVAIKINEGNPNVAMLGIGAYRPTRIVSNDEVCETLDSSDEWIYERSGIRNRRYISGDETAKSMAIAAAERAIENSGVPKEKIGAILLATLSWKTKIPHGAPQIAFELGINGIPAFDIASGCGGFGYGLGIATDMVRAGSAEYVVVIGVETLSVVLDPTDRNTAFIFGDGAG